MSEEKIRPWDRYVQKHSLQESNNIRSAKPWDLLNPNIGRVSDELAVERLSICQNCPSYKKRLKQCKECGCIMPAKVKLPNAFCPLGKWSAVEE